MDPTLRQIRGRRPLANVSSAWAAPRNAEQANETADALIETLDLLGHRTDLDHEAEGLVASDIRQAKALRRYVQTRRP